jgi:spore cortex formation protein SpoVR/YcgB (stage V sporulation)
VSILKSINNTIIQTPSSKSTFNHSHSNNKKKNNRSTIENESDHTSNTLEGEEEDDNENDNDNKFHCKIPSKSLLSVFKNLNSIEKNVERCTILIKYIPISQQSSARIYDFEATSVTRIINSKNEEQLYETKFLIVMHCKYGEFSFFNNNVIYSKFNSKYKRIA